MSNQQNLMDWEERLANYQIQNGKNRITPRQFRRLRKKHAKNTGVPLRGMVDEYPAWWDEKASAFIEFPEEDKHLLEKDD